ncbi:hypothetical protein QJR30_17900 [Paraclostridium sordellii]|uniref:hypothetical protein n=1 Tax=Paraclostridium sordellii TaxID=1505 RepID=UPI0005E5B9E8|nr:hypothetical protein [Paeniclostridium sordellii]CEP81890.1 Uncharacterised protein [[Clostridium] sordellii] [Paeniclostridium sordellii]
MSNFNYIKGLYEDGFRCIYHNSDNNCHTVYLKNFDSEKSEVIELENAYEFNQLKDYMDTLKMQ